jgi:hypothetical protein
LAVVSVHPRAAGLREKHYQSLARHLHQEPSFDEDLASSLDEDTAQARAD